jgi:hypothetical protein
MALVLKNEKDTIIAQTSQRDTCIVEDNQALSSQQSFVASEDENLGEIIDVTLCPKVTGSYKNVASIGSVQSVELRN